MILKIDFRNSKSIFNKNIKILIFFFNFIIKIFNNSKNNYIMNLKKDKLLFSNLNYILSIIKLNILKIYIKINKFNNFI